MIYKKIWSAIKVLVQFKFVALNEVKQIATYKVHDRPVHLIIFPSTIINCYGWKRFWLLQKIKVLHVKEILLTLCIKISYAAKKFLENLWEHTRIYFVGLGKISYGRLVSKDNIFYA